MSSLKIGWNPVDHFCPLSFRYNLRFQSFLKSGVKPFSYRRFDSDTKQWSVHVSKIALVVAYAKTQFDTIDYSALPGDVQIEIAARASGRVKKGPSVQSSPYDVLHLLPSAPFEVVKAAYKALALLHHPDRGGDEEVFKEINAAYEIIVEEQEKSNVHD